MNGDDEEPECRTQVGRRKNKGKVGFDSSRSGPRVSVPLPSPFTHVSVTTVLVPADFVGEHFFFLVLYVVCKQGVVEIF